MNIREILTGIKTWANSKFVSKDQAAPVEPGDAENSLVQEGSSAVAFGVNSTAFGTSTTNAKERGITEESTSEEIVQEWAASDPEDQKFALTLGEGSHIEGNNCLALGKNSHAEGNGTVASDNSSHAEGTGSIAAGPYAHAEGLETIASGSRAHAEGQDTHATNKSSHAEGKGTEASGERAHAEGVDTVASGKNSHAEGNSTSAIGETSHAEGTHTVAQSSGSHAEGYYSLSRGIYSHSEGKGYTGSDPRYITFYDHIKSAATESALYQTLDYSSASAKYKTGMKLWKLSTDEGETWDDVLDQNITITEVYSGNSAWFKLSKKLNIGNKATRYALFIACEIGVSGDYSHGEGIDPWTSNEGEHAEGKYNKSNDGTVSSVGIGDSDNDRKNAFEIMQNGLVFIYGVNGYNGTNIDTSSTGNSLQAALRDAGITVDDSLFGWE